MFLLEVNVEGRARSVEKKLPSQTPNLQIDPRPILQNQFFGNYDDYSLRMTTFEITYTYHDNGTTVTFTRTDNDQEWWSILFFRVYDPAKEVVPSFESTIYTYLGIEGERAPYNTVVGIISPSAKVIQKRAFACCKKMKICLMHDDVEVVEGYAFYLCEEMKRIRLSRSLARIGESSFHNCFSLDAIFAPSSMKEVGRYAFSACKNMRILSLPPTINSDQMGYDICHSFQNFFNITQIQRTANDERDNQLILDFYRNLPPLYQVCRDTNVSAEKIEEFSRNHQHDARISAATATHGGMTPLHVLVLNPHATIGSIHAYLNMNIDAAAVDDSLGKTPIDYLREHGNVDMLLHVIQALCIHWNACSGCARQRTSH